MKADQSMRYEPCPCGSGTKFKFCCWPKFRHLFRPDMTRDEIVRMVRCAETGTRDPSSDGEARAEKGPDKRPRGIMEMPDDNRTSIMRPVPKWQMRLDFDESITAEDDADKVVADFLRPYFERYCNLDDLDGRHPAEVAILHASFTRTGLETCPTVELARFEQMWDVLRSRIVEFLESVSTPFCFLEVRKDDMFGGPILTLVCGNLKESLMVVHPDRHGSDPG